VVSLIILNNVTVFNYNILRKLIYKICNILYVFNSSMYLGLLLYTPVLALTSLVTYSVLYYYTLMHEYNLEHTVVYI
jgi:hypothetical protein